jgi:hypothetical protein
LVLRRLGEGRRPRYQRAFIRGRPPLPKPPSSLQIKPKFFLVTRVSFLSTPLQGKFFFLYHLTLNDREAGFLCRRLPPAVSHSVTRPGSLGPAEKDLHLFFLVIFWTVFYWL